MKPILIILGIIFGILSFFSPGSLFIFLLFLIAIFLINYLTNKDELRFIKRLFLFGFAARIVAVLLIMFFSIVAGRTLNYALEMSPECPSYSTPYIFSDSGYYTLRAQFTKMYWLGEPITKHAVREYVKLTYGFTGFIYILAGFFAIFGYSPIASRFINCFLGALIAIVVYYIAKELFNEKVARLASILTAFTGSLFLWSITNLKDTSLIFMFCIMLWSMVKFKGTKKVYYLIIAGLSIYLQVFIQPSLGTNYIYLNIGILISYLLFSYILKLPRRKKIAISLFIFIMGAFFIFSKSEKLKLYANKAIQNAYIHHKGVINEGGICYKLFSDKFYASHQNINYNEFIKMLGIGWLHIMSEPLPWKVQSKFILFSLPQMISWYLLIPFSVLGIILSIRFSFEKTFILFIYFFIMVSILAINEANIGTLFRHRDIITPIFLIFASAGILKLGSDKY